MRSLRARLFVWVGLVVLLTVGVTLAVGIVLIRRSIQRSLLDNLAMQAEVVALRQEQGALSTAQQLALRVFFRRVGERLAFLPLPVPDSPLVPEDARAALDAGRATSGKATVAGLDILYAGQPAGDRAVLLVRGAALGSGDWGPFVGAFAIAGVAGAIMAAVTAFLLARAIARPVGRVARASRKLASGEAPERVPVEGSDELAVLAASFNQMSDQLSGAREAERSFLMSVSHELKTPLTAIKGYAEGLEEGAVDPREAGVVIGREGARLERLVQDLLDLAGVSRRSFAVRRQPVDLADVAREAVLRYEPRSRAFEVTLSADAPEASPALGDHDRIMQVVSNLVENALRTTPAGGTVTVSARPGELTVEDSGPGLSQEDLSRAFERFFLFRRYGADRPVGTGLGLAIVKDLTEAMGGTVAVESPPGRGATFRVTLPIPPRTSPA